MIVPWELFDAEHKAFEQSKRVGNYDFNIFTQPKQRSHGATKAATRTWEKAVYEDAAEQAPRIVPAGRLGMHVLFLAQKKTGDLSNCLKTIEDALNRRGYKDDEQIDALKVVRYYGPDVERDRICVKIFER